MIADQIKQKLSAALEKAALSVSPKSFTLTHPENSQFGDYSSSIALQLSKELKKNPMEITEQIVNAIEKSDIIEKVEAVKPGFINFYLNPTIFFKDLISLSQNHIEYLPFHYGPEKKVMVEYGHPNTLKLFHIGHLRNITTGETLARLLEASGNSVIRANYQGDVGLHIAKTLWEIRKKLSKSPEARKTIDSLDTHGKIALIGKAYAAGNAAYETDEKAKQEIIEVNKMIYNNDPEIMPLYEETRQWSLDYFEEIYSLVDTKYDVYYFESQMAKRAVEIINDGVTKGIFEKNDGAIILNGEKHGVDTRVFLNQIGLPTYEGKDMALAEKEFNDFGTLDQNIHTVAGEQTSFFKTLFKAQELYFGYTKGKQKHQVYGWVDVKGQKMSSRKGNVVEGEWLINEAKKQILESFEKTDESVAAQLAMASIKYIFLKAGLQNKIDVDLNEAVSINGNSAPYLLYTYVRTKSILAKKTPTYSINQDTEINENELQLLRELIKYPEVVHDATKNVSPHLIATYLFNLAQSFNLFYQKNPILKAEAEIKELRLLITQATSNIIKDGLRLLGIQTVEKM